MYLVHFSRSSYTTVKCLEKIGHSRVNALGCGTDAEAKESRLKEDEIYKKRVNATWTGISTYAVEDLNDLRYCEGIEMYGRYAHIFSINDLLDKCEGCVIIPDDFSSYCYTTTIADMKRQGFEWALGEDWDIVEVKVHAKNGELTPTQIIRV